MKVTQAKKRKKFRANRAPNSVRKLMPIDSRKSFRLGLLKSATMTLVMWEKPKWQ
jgi:hypothetical protein